jgi:hypothetical protein
MKCIRAGKNFSAHPTGYRFGFVVIQSKKRKLPDRYDTFVVRRAKERCHESIHTNITESRTTNNQIHYLSFILTCNELDKILIHSITAFSFNATMRVTG